MNNKFNKRLENLPSNIISKIAQIDEFKGQWIGGAKLSPQILGNLKKSVLITSTGSSTRIEGSKLSDKEVEKTMGGITLQKFSDRDKQEVRGYYELLENIFSSYTSIPFSEGTIKFFHSELLKYTEKDKTHRGRYKKKENKVHMVKDGKSVGILFDTTPAYLTSKEIQELVEWTKENLEQKRYHYILVILNFIVEFLKIHPFEDGNGRLSRILTNLLLLHQGYEYMIYTSHEKLVEKNKTEYYLSLRQSQTTFNTKKEAIIPWLNFSLDILLKQSKVAVDLISRENTEILLSQKQLAVWKYLEKVKESSPREISKETDVAYETVRQSLRKLEGLKKIERVGQGRATRYRVV